MTVLGRLGLRLVGAGGVLRAGSVVLGSAVVVALVALAWALPDAMYPVLPGTTQDTRRTVLVDVLWLLAAPTFALLVVVGRLSSRLRDRRLASLRLLGVSRRGVAVVAATESGVPTAVGAVLGVGGFVAARAVARVALADVLQAPVVGGLRLLVVAVGVVVASMALSLASTHAGRDSRSAAAPSAARRPSWWRLTPVLLALAGFGVVLAPHATWNGRTVLVLLATVLLSGVGVVTAAPVVGWWASVLLVRTAGLAALLAGRAVQAQGPGQARRATAIGATVLVVLAASGYLAVWESDHYLGDAVHQVEVGPQLIRVDSTTGQALSPDLLTGLAQLPGVLSVRARGAVGPADCADGQTCAAVFVGTCAELAVVAVVPDCRDDEPAWLTWHDAPAWLDNWSDPPPHPGAIDLQVWGAGTVRLPVGATWELDLPATMRTWTYPTRWDLFVPVAATAGWGLTTTGADVVAGPGSPVQRAVAAFAAQHQAWPDAWAAAPYQSIVSTRTAVWAVTAASLAVTLLAYALAAVDQARGSRRARARLVAVGAPAGLLRRAQAVANLVPLGAALALALTSGTAVVWALTRLIGRPFGLDTLVVGSALGAVLVGVLVVAGVTVPLTRRTLTAGDLRQE